MLRAMPQGEWSGNACQSGCKIRNTCSGLCTGNLYSFAYVANANPVRERKQEKYHAQHRFDRAADHRRGFGHGSDVFRHAGLESFRGGSAHLPKAKGSGASAPLPFVIPALLLARQQFDQVKQVIPPGVKRSHLEPLVEAVCAVTIRIGPHARHPIGRDTDRSEIDRIGRPG